MRIHKQKPKPCNYNNRQRFNKNPQLFKSFYVYLISINGIKLSMYLLSLLLATSFILLVLHTNNKSTKVKLIENFSNKKDFSNGSELTKNIAYNKQLNVIQNQDNTEGGILNYFNKFSELINYLNSKIYINKTTQFKECLASLLQFYSDSLMHQVQIIMLFVENMKLTKDSRIGCVEDTRTFYMYLFEYLQILELSYFGTYIDTKDYTDNNELIIKKKANIRRFIFQQYYLQYLLIPVIELLKNFKNIILKIFKEQLVSLGVLDENDKKGIFIIFKGLVYLFERNKEEMFEKGPFKISMNKNHPKEDKYNISVKYLLKNLDKFAELCKLYFSLVLILLFDIDETGKITHFKDKAYLSILKTFRDRKNQKKNENELKLLLENITRKCESVFNIFLEENYTDRYNDFYNKFRDRNRSCLLELYRLKEKEWI